MTRERRAILIAGPTASGKSALALRLAEERGGVVMNADSMQNYSGLRILTARPSAEDETRAPHCLYGHVDPSRSYSAGEWLRAAGAALEESWAEGRMPIVVGGTGLYFAALLGGLDAMPEIPPAVREHWRGRLAAEGAPALHALLASVDPASATRIRPADGQRVARALEIADAGASRLSDLQARRGVSPLADAVLERYVLMPPRAILRERIAARFDAMMVAGAMEEVRRFLARDDVCDAPAAKAIGVAELGSVLAGECDLRDAVESAKNRSRRYAKRQDTWFKNQLGPEWTIVSQPLDATSALCRSLDDVHRLS